MLKKFIKFKSFGTIFYKVSYSKKQRKEFIKKAASL